MGILYQRDLAYIHADGFGSQAVGAVTEILRLLKNARIPIRRVVDVGCGAGALTKALVEGGFEVTGIDSSPELLQIARRVCPVAKFLNASIYDMPIPACEAVIALGEPLTYHADDGADERVRRFFRHVSSVIPAGGLLIFDIIELGEPALTGRSWSSGADWAILVETTENQSERTLVREIETFRRIGKLYRRGREVHRVRLFDTRWLCAELSFCGFTTKTAESYGQQLLPRRRRAFIATKNA